MEHNLRQYNKNNGQEHRPSDQNKERISQFFFVNYKREGVWILAKDVLCEVNNCAYWAKGNECTADRIYVVSHTGEQATNTKETDCKTFEPEV